MTGVSAENAGIYNWTIKRDFRRDKDLEILSEGYDRFAPNPLNAIQPEVGGEPITLIAMLRRANGQIAVVVGTKTTLFRYFGLDNGAYFDGVGSDAYFEESAQYFDDNPGVWIEIGSGFSSQGKRWEAIPINGYLVMNNGVDLPMTYRVEDSEVAPIYELREQGITSVGTIVEIDGILVCMDIREIDADKHVEIMTPLAGSAPAQVVGILPSSPILGKVNSGVDGVNGNTLTVTAGGIFDLSGLESIVGRTIRMANGLTRTITVATSPTVATLDGAADLAEPNQPVYLIGPDDNKVTPNIATLFPGLEFAGDPERAVGLQLFWASGEIRTIVDITDDGYYLVDSDAPIAEGNVSIENPAAYTVFTEESFINHFQWRVLWALPDLPRRFGAIIPCSVDPTSNTLNLRYPVRSLESGQDILILGAGTGGGNLTATIALALPNQLIISEGAITDAASEIQASIAAARAVETDAQTTVDSTASTLQVAQGSLDAANAAVVDPPEHSDPAVLQQAAAAASAAVDAARANSIAAEKALTDATAARETSEQLLQPVDSSLMLADAFSSITGKFEDLIGDGSAILKALALRGYLIIYKANSTIFVAQYTGTVEKPFNFEDLQTPASAALRYRDTLIAVRGKYHLYAGQNAFYRFDLVNRTPLEMAEFQLCQDVFFEGLSAGAGNPLPFVSGHTFVLGPPTYRVDFVTWSGLDASKVYQLTTDGKVQQLTNITTYQLPIRSTAGAGITYAASYSLTEVVSGEDLIFAADNPVTREIFFCFPSAGDDKMLRFDYRHGTVSTSSMALTSAGAVQRPESQVVVGNGEVWMVAGTDDGLLLRYGLIDGQSRRSGAITATKAANSNVVTASQVFFEARMVGKSIKFSSGKIFAITAFTSATEVQVVGAGSVTSETFSIENAIYHRDGQEYDGVMQSGVDAFGATNVEKRVNGYVLYLGSQSPGVPIGVALRGGVNAADMEDAIATTIASPRAHNLLPATWQGYFIGDRITVSGVNHFVSVAGRSLVEVGGINSKAFFRKP